MKATGPTSFTATWDHQAADYFVVSIYLDHGFSHTIGDIMQTHVDVPSLGAANVYGFSVAGVFDRRTGEFNDVLYDVSSK